VTSPARPRAIPGFLRHLLGFPGLLAALLWGLAEGTVFFIVPDILITLTALFSLRESLKQTALVVAGSLLAGTILYTASVAHDDRVMAAVRQVPFVRAGMFERTREDFERHGVWAMLRGPTSGIPYKVYAAQAPRYCRLAAFIVVSIPARLERLLLSWALFAAAGWFLRGRIGRNPGTAVPLHGIYWASIYAYYWSVI